MARASAKGGSRPSPDARKQPAEPVEELGDAAPAETQAAKPQTSGVKPVRRGSRVVSRTAAAEPAAERATPQKKSDNWEDQLFFARLRRHMEWVFALLAALFAIGFVVFGVGAGGTGVGDFLGDLFGGSSPTAIQSVQDARKKVEENPQDTEALLALAAAYRSTDQPKLQAETLEQYLELRPDDADAVSQLGRAYFVAAQRQAAEASTDAGVNQTPLTSDLCTFPGTSGIIGAVCDDPIDQALTAASGQQVAEIFSRSQVLYESSVDAFTRLAELRPDDPSSWLFLGNAAENAGNQEAQLAAFEEFLKRFPDNPNAADIEQIVKQLKESNDTLVG